jgi:hypothetical protein
LTHSPSRRQPDRATGFCDLFPAKSADSKLSPRFSHAQTGPKPFSSIRNGLAAL